MKRNNAGHVVCRRVVQMVQRRYPASELLAAGWSLGGNILVRYLGEEGAASPISAAASLCNPLDLVSPYFFFVRKQIPADSMHLFALSRAAAVSTSAFPLCCSGLFPGSSDSFIRLLRQIPSSDCSVRFLHQVPSSDSFIPSMCVHAAASGAKLASYCHLAPQLSLWQCETSQ